MINDHAMVDYILASNQIVLQGNLNVFRPPLSKQRIESSKTVKVRLSSKHQTAGSDGFQIRPICERITIEMPCGVQLSIAKSVSVMTIGQPVSNRI